MPLFSPVTDQAFPSLSLAPSFLVAAPPHKKEDIMTAAQQEQKGKQEGEKTKALDIAKHMLSTLHLDMQAVAQQLGEKYEQQGRQQEKLHIAKNMLSKGFDAKLIGELTGISEEEL